MPRPAKKRHQKPLAYGHGHIARAPNGRGCDASITVAGRRLRARLPSLDAAKAWLDAQDPAAALPPLTAAQLRDAQAALALLPPGATLAQAAQAYAKTASLRGALPDLFAAFAAARKDLRAKTLCGYRAAVRRAVRALGPDLAAYTPAALRAFLAPLTPAMHNQLLRSLSAILSWGAKNGLLPHNPAAGIAAVRVTAPRRAILTVGQARALLAHAEAAAPRFLPYLPLCLFAGLRPNECLRLRPADVGAEYILLTEAHAKTASARTVPIRPNLRDWLAAHPLPAEGPTHGLSESRFRRTLLAAARAAGVPWGHDILRHTFASYAYELSRDAPATAYEMGHQGTAIFFRHYRGLVPPGSGQSYFAIRPTFANALPTSCTTH